MANSVLQIEVDADVGVRLVAEAKAKGEPLPKVAGDLVREALENRDDYDAWFIREVEIGLRQADAPGAVFIPNEAIQAEFKIERERLIKLAESLGL